MYKYSHFAYAGRKGKVEKGEAGERDCPLGLLSLMRAVKKVLYMWVINLGERAEQ